MCIVAGVFAGVARALDFDDENPAPVQSEVGRVIDYKIGTHAGCLPHHLVILSGAVPPGTTLTQVDDHTGLVSGIPTAEGTYTVWLAVKDCANKSAETLFEFDIGRRTYAIQTASLPAASLGASYSAKLKAGDHPIQSEQWTVAQGQLPAGLTLSTDGVISGTPSVAGASTFTLKATSIGDDGAVRIDTHDFTLTVTGSVAFTSSRRIAEVGVPFHAKLSANGGQAPLTWSVDSVLPQGVTIDPQGVIGGVPKRAGTYVLAVRFVDAAGSSMAGRVALVVRPRLAVTARSLRTAVVGHAYRAPVAARGGVAGFRWTIVGGALPGGLRLSARTGIVFGTAGTAGVFRFTVRVRDALGAVATGSIVLRVR